MKRMSWKTAICCGLALSLNCTDQVSRGFAEGDGIVSADAQAGGGDRKGGGNPAGGGNRGGNAQSGRGNGSHGAGSAKSQPSQHGNSQRPGSQGGIHAPSIGGPRSLPNQGGKQPNTARSPSFNHPDRAAKPRITVDPPTTKAPGGSPKARAGSNLKNPLVGIPGNIRQGDHAVRQISGDVSAAQRFGHTQSRIGNRPFTGNSLNYNNRHFNLGHNLYQPAYYRHAGYHGYWNGNRGFNNGSGFGYGPGYGLSSNLGYGGGYGPGWGWGLGNGYRYGSGFGNRGYGYRPLGWGLGGWGLGSLIYNSGYLGYSNPYYLSSNGSRGYNYSQPIQVSYNAPVAVTSNAQNSSDDVLNNAIAAFQQNDYDAALDMTNKGIAQYPDDAVLHEFRSLVLFAKQDYQQSASTIHSVLAVGPGWDWTTLSSMYSSVAVYTDQLRALEAFTKSNPQDAASHFLLAYHYLSCGHTDPATRQLQQVVTLMPGDRVAADMLKMVAAPPVEETSQPPLPGSLEQTRPEVTPIDPNSLVGAWHAARDDGSTFNLNLAADAAFTWSFTQKGQAAQEFGGTYSVEGNVLALERKDGGSLIAEITPADGSKFNFKLLGASAEDAGLDFSR